MFKTILILILAGLTLLGLGTIPVRIDCEPAPSTASGAAPPLFDCHYQSSRLWGLWPNQAGMARGVSALERDERHGTSNDPSWALRLRTPSDAIPIVPHHGAAIAPTLSDDFAALLGAGRTFTFRAVLVERLMLLPGYFFLGIGLLCIAGFPLSATRRPDEAAGHAHKRWHQRWRRIGRDNSFLALPFGLFAIGVPVWIGLLILYLLTCFALVSLADCLPPDTSKHFAGSGPALLGLIDLVRRLRTVEYCWFNQFGLETCQRASLLDRLTFRECGWYLPIFNVPLPLWLLGGALTIILLNP